MTTCAEAGTLLGVFETIEAVETDCVLKPGDTVVFYTDGVTDVAPPFYLSAEQLAEIVGEAARPSSSATEMAAHLLGRLSAILSFDQRSDDIALLIFHVSDEPVR